MKLRKLALLAIIVLAPIASSLIGYRSGYFDGVADEYQLSDRTATTFPTWVDQEVHSLSGGNGAFVSVSCTEHRADGTVRITDRVMGIRDAGKKVC